MENLISEKPQSVEPSTENEQEPKNVIPEGFVEDDQQPSFFLEDLEGENEVWLIECPETVDPSKLLGKQLHFSHQTFFKTDEESNEKCVAIPTKKDGAVCCLLSSNTEESVKAAALQNVGKIRLNISYDVPDLGCMIPDGTSVPLPEGLKMRHPFLGPKYRDVLASMKKLKENLFRNANEDKPMEVHRKKKKKSIGANNLPDISCPEKDDHLDGFESKFCVAGEGVEYTSPKKSKKKKREYIDDLAARDESQVHGGTSTLFERTLKKIKKEKKHLTEASDNNMLDVSQTHFQELEFRGDNKGSILSEFEDEVLPSPKKSKKQKWESHYVDANEVDSHEMPEIIEFDVQHVSKKIKKEKRHAIESTGDRSSSIIDISESAAELEFPSPKKKKKKKHDSQNAGSSITADESQEELAVFDDGSKQVSKKIKKEKKQVLSHEGDNSTVHSEQLVATYDESGHVSRKIKKKEKDSKYQDNSVTTEDSQEELVVVHEGSSHVSKKIKKEKKKDSNYQDNIISTEDSQEELAIVHEENGHVSKKIKKEKKKDSKYHEESGHVSKKIKKEKKHDISAVEEHVPEEEIHERQEFMNEEGKKAKKKKKRHTIDTSEVSIVPEIFTSEEEIKVISSSSKKKKTKPFLGNEMELLSPKKEAKIKHEHLELDLIDSPKEKKRKKEKRKSLTEM